MFNVTVYEPIQYESIVYHVEIGGDDTIQFLVWNVTASPPRFELINARATVPTQQVSFDRDTQRRIAEYKVEQLKRKEQEHV